MVEQKKNKIRAARAPAAGRDATGRRGERPEAEVARLLAKLAEPGAYAVAAEEGRLSIHVRRASTTLGGGTVSRAAAERLVSAGGAEWTAGDGEGSRPRLVATDAGRARRRREAAEPDRAFLVQHLDIGRERLAMGDGGDSVDVDRSESPLAWLARRRDRNGEPMIDAAAFAAGERLRLDFTLAQMLPRVTASWEAPTGQRGGPPLMLASERALAARQRAERALAAVGGEFAGLLLDVCGFLKGLEQVEREHGWPARCGKVLLRMALGRLAAHYGLAAAARGPDAARGIRVWSAGDGAAETAGRATPRG